MSKFKTTFNQVVIFSAGFLVLSRLDFNREQAEKLFKKEWEGCNNTPFIPECINQTFIRFGFPPSEVEDHDPADGPIWYTKSGYPYKKGDMPVWVYDGWKSRRWHNCVMRALKNKNPLPSFKEFIRGFCKKYNCVVNVIDQGPKMYYDYFCEIINKEN